MTPFPVLAVVFDLDGTLIDSESVYRGALAMALADLGLEADPAFVQGLNGLAGPAVKAHILARFGDDFPTTSFRRRYAVHRDALTGAGMPLKPGAAEALDFVAGRGLRLGLATSAQRETAEDHLNRFNLLARFDAVVTREDVARPKPFPDLFLEAAARLGVAASGCLAVEDSPTGVQAALAAGMMTLMVPDVAVPTADMRARCVAVHASLRELPGLFPD